MKKTLLSLSFLLAVSGVSYGETNHQHHHDHHAMGAEIDVKNLPPFAQEYLAGMDAMHGDMMAGILDKNADLAFARGMLPHHEGAVAMAKTQLKYGKDETMRKLAEEIIKAQEGEIELMKKWIGEQPKSEQVSEENLPPVNKDYVDSMDVMHKDMMAGISEKDPDLAFAKGMLPHHEGAVEMGKIQLKYGQDETMRKLAEDIIEAQEGEIQLMRDWIKEHEHAHHH